MRTFALTLISIFIMSSAFADQGAAKAIIIRGKVNALINGKTVPVKKGVWLPEGAQVKTEKKSFAKLLFKDKSTMNVGPDSQMKIDAFPEKDAGIITLVKGTIRSKVTKNYMKMEDKEKSKLFIKTKTAAMGVRGTDFQVAFNPVNLNTSLITFEGAVAMAKMAEMVGSRLNQGALEGMVSGPNAVMVRRGQFSAANQGAGTVTIPVKISPVQLETLESNESMGTDPSSGSTSDTSSKKSYKSIVPPGMDAKDVANDLSTTESVLGESMGADVMSAVNESIASEQATEIAPPEGGIVDGKVAPKAGGFIDIKTAQYIPPPENSTFDAASNTYTMSSDMGYIDPATGDFKNDNFELKEDGSWQEKAPSTDGGRSIASANDANSAPPEVQKLDVAEVQLDIDLQLDPTTAENIPEFDVQIETTDPDALPPVINQAIQNGAGRTKVNFDVVSE